MINWFGVINPLGYGIHNQNMIKAFVDNDIDINLNIVGAVQEDPYYKTACQKAFSNINKFDKNSPSIYCFHAEHANQYCGNPMATFAIFETTKIDPTSIRNLKNVADVVLTTTEKHKEILIDNGINEKKIHIVHEGIDPNLYNTDECIKFIDTDKFTFITAGKCEKRKNTDMIISSFIDTMQYNECALIAHTHNPFAKHMKQKFPWTTLNLQAYGFSQVGDTQEYLKFSNGPCDIYFTKPGISTGNMRSLYRSANVGVYYTHGGAWELGIIETMACGIPCITSNVLGPLEYLSETPKIQKDLIIEPTGMEVANDGYWFKGDKGEWASLNKYDLCDMIEDVYDYKDKYKECDVELSKFYHNNYNWGLAANKIHTIFNS